MIRNFILVCSVFCTMFVQGQMVGFEKTYDVFPFFDITGSVQQTADGGYIVSGYGGTTKTDLYLIRTDGNGDTMWVKTYGVFVTNEQGGYARQTTDGGYIITGSTEVGGSNVEVWLIKTDGNGSIEWDNTYGGGALIDAGAWVEQTTDGGYIVTGSFSWTTTNKDVWLIKTDSAGTIEWDNTYGGIDKEGGMAVQQTTDNGYIIAGSTNSYGAGFYDIYLIKTDSVGDTIWTKTYGDIDCDEAWDVKQTMDGGYIVTGKRSNCSEGYIMKTNAVGDSVWTKTISTYAAQVVQTDDGGYAVVSSIDNGPPTYGDVYLIKMDGSGNTLWARSYSNDSLAGSPEIGWAIGKTSDGGFILAGETGSPGSDVYLVKTDSLGYIDSVSVGINSHWVLVDEVQVYPNPFAESTTFEIRGMELPGSFVMYDQLGSEVKRLQVSSSKFQVGRDGLSDGVYFYHISNSTGHLLTGKLVIH